MNRTIRSVISAVAIALAIAGGGTSHVGVRAQVADDEIGSWFIELNDSVNAFRGQAQAAGMLIRSGSSTSGSGRACPFSRRPAPRLFLDGCLR